MIKVVANTKGGVGKSVISSMIMPFVCKTEDIVIHEFDDNNVTKIKNTTLTFDNVKASKSENKIDDILFDKLMDKKVSHIIDCGGGNDTIKVLDFLKDSDLIGLDYYIPANDDLEQVKNVLDTIQEIKSRDKQAKINIIFNRCNNLNEDDIKEQFVGFFGSEPYGISGVMDTILNDTENIYFVKNTSIFGILKNIYNTTLHDSYKEAKEITKNISKYQKEWLKLGKTEFKNKMKFYKFLKDVVKFVENDLKSFRG